MYLSQNEANDCHGSTEKSGQHEDLKAVDDALVVESTD